MIVRLLGAAALTMVAATAAAKDDQPCAKGMVCASAPGTIVKVMQEAGFKAKLTTDRLGDPMIESAASGYNYELLFYGCENKRDCDSVQFYMKFDKGVENTPAYANKWNVENRFIQMAAHPDTTLSLQHDVSTVGGLTPANFKDLLDWWQMQLGEARDFFRANDPDKSDGKLETPVAAVPATVRRATRFSGSPR